MPSAAESTETEKRPLIHAPIKLVLTEEGVDHFLKNNQRLARYKLSDNTEEFGLRLYDFSPVTIQRMIFFGFAAAVELPVKDVRNERKNIVDLSKLLAHGMLYRQFDSEVWNCLVRSELIKNWNRQNPRNPIDHKTRPNAEFLRRVLKGRIDMRNEISASVLDPILTGLRREESLHPRERRIRGLLAEKYLEYLGDLSWFILTTYRKDKACDGLIDGIRILLSTYLDRAGISEFIAMLIIELLTFLMNNPSEKSEIEAGSSGLSLVWKFRRRRNLPDDRAKLTVVLCDRGAVRREVNAKIYERATIQIRERSLSDLYKAGGGDSEIHNLGLYYLSFLKDACRNMDILFESFVTSTAGGKTLVNLGFTF